MMQGFMEALKAKQTIYQQQQDPLPPKKPKNFPLFLFALFEPKQINVDK